MTIPSRISRTVIVSQLKLAARKGDRVALALAIEQMRTWAYSPRYWRKYLELLSHPLARLVDLTVIKQGDRIAHQKGWIKPKREAAKARRRACASTLPRSSRPSGGTGPGLALSGSRLLSRRPDVLSERRATTGTQRLRPFSVATPSRLW